MTEAALIKAVRAHDVERDGYCRVAKNLTVGFLGPCGGPSEWAHFGRLRRCFTRNMPAEQRHTVEGSFMLCHLHHQRYDAHAFDVEPLTDKGCEGPLAFLRGENRFEEATT